MGTLTPSPLDLLDTVQQVAPYLKWRLFLEYTYDGERVLAIGGHPHTALSPDEAKIEAVRVFEAADKAAHLEPAYGVWLDVHVIASDGRQYGSEMPT